MTMAFDTPFAFGHRQAFKLMSQILRHGGEVDAAALAHALRMSESEVLTHCGVLAADRLVKVRREGDRTVYAATGSQFSELLEKLSDSYSWRADCATARHPN